jgi:putative addiction module killer protein
VIEVREYIDPSGRSPFERWLAKLDEVTRFRVAQVVARMSSGNFSAAKAVGRGVSEMRLDFGPGYRIYFGKDGETLVILLGGGSKQRQQNDIELAQALWQQYKQQKREE